MENIISVNNVNKKLNGKRVISGVNLNVKKGDIYGLVGKNGAGKTTLMRLILSMLSVDSGTIDIPSRIITEKKIGALIENPAFYPYLTVKENLNYYRILKSIPDKSCVDEIIESVGLKDAYNKKFKQLSLGMKQRLGIGLTLLGNPELLILDEPINGLDPEGIMEMRELFLNKNKTEGITILISSHILTELSQVSNRFGFIDNGVLIKEVTKEQIENETSEQAIIKVDDVEKAIIILKENGINNEIKEGNEILIESKDKSISNINQLMCNNGICVYELKRNIVSLEEYFLELLKEGDK